MKITQTMIRFLYKKVLKPILFLTNPEWIHDRFVDLGEFFGRTQLGRNIIKSIYGHNGKDINIKVDGLIYKSPVMLAAGFDYNGRLAGILQSLSFGGDEIGSVTARLCEGNPKPRLKRMIKSQGLIVYKGLKNEGVDKVIDRLKRTKKPDGMIWGISIAKTNDPKSCTVQDGIEDYAYSLKRLVESDTGDFYTINISCPNAFGGENFAEPERLTQLMEALDGIVHTRPVYIKMPINLEWDAFNALLIVLNKHRVHGVVIGNLNKNYDEVDFPDEAPMEYRGGLSGKCCQQRSTALIRQTKEHWDNRFTIIGCGGILSVQDAMEKLDAGADLLQLITGMIFEGPHLMSDICNAYAARMDAKKAPTVIRTFVGQ
jgi:dihydroorotate dehydrogenase